VAETADELGRVGVDGEAEAEQLEPFLVRRLQQNVPVRALAGLPEPAARQRRLVRTAVRHQVEPVGPGRSDDVLKHRLAPYCSPQMRLADAISLRSRRRKFALFMAAMAPTAETSVLDIGVDDFAFGEPGCGCKTLNFFEELYPWRERITALGLHEGTRFRERYPTSRYVQGNALELPFADGEFDVVFSNAVIEHVGDRPQQRRFVEESLRVARRAFITTPNRWFPVEVHTMLPLVHWLPDAVSHRAYDLARKSWAKENRLLGPKALRELFPPGTRIVNQGMTLVAIVG
jgi:SAM-dependent methyltransferase